MVARFMGFPRFERFASRTCAVNQTTILERESVRNAALARQSMVRPPVKSPHCSSWISSPGTNESAKPGSCWWRGYPMSVQGEVMRAARHMQIALREGFRDRELSERYRGLSEPAPRRMAVISMSNAALAERLTALITITDSFPFPDFGPARKYHCS